MITNIFDLGVRRAWIELRRAAKSTKDLWSYLSSPIVFLVLAALNPTEAPLFVAGGLASASMMIALASLPQLLAAENGDGTLLRVRGLPYGMAAYVISKIVFVVAITLVSCVVILAGTVMINPGAVPHDAPEWATLAWVLVVGIAAFVPLGLLLGAVLPNSREAIGLAMLPVIGLLMISGVFFPASLEPRWLRLIADVFPLSWAAQGMHAALAAGHLAPWPAGPALAVMLAWCLFGTVAATAAVSAMARRQSGSALTRRRKTVTA